MKTIIYMYNNTNASGSRIIPSDSRISLPQRSFASITAQSTPLGSYTIPEFNTQLLDSFILLVVIRRTVIFIYFNNSYANAESLVM